MTLSEINAQINSYQSMVTTLASQLHELVSEEAEADLYLAKSWIATFDGAWSDSLLSMIRRTEYAILYLYKTLEHTLIEYEVISNSNKDQLQSIMMSYNNVVTDYVQKALVQIDAQNGITLAEVDARITAIVSAAQSTINGNIADLEASVTSQLSSVTTELNTDIDSLGVTVSDLETTFFDELATSAGEIYATVTDWVDGLWNGIEAAYQWATDQVNAMYESIYTWAAEKFDDLSAIVSVGFTNIGLVISDKIASVMSAIDAAKTHLTAFINSSVDALQEVIDYSVETINNAMTDLSISLDWRFNFFNIALALPELSILQVLTRPDEFFDEYKSYWQALIARILEDK